MSHDEYYELLSLRFSVALMRYVEQCKTWRRAVAAKSFHEHRLEALLNELTPESRMAMRKMISDSTVVTTKALQLIADENQKALAMLADLEAMDRELRDWPSRIAR